MQVCGRIARHPDVCDFFDANSSSLQAVAHRRGGKTGTVLYAIKSFLFNSSNDSPVFDQSRSSVTVIRIDT
jgi:hypothetical protein